MNRNARLAAADCALEEFLTGKLFADPAGHVDISTAWPTFRQWLPEGERALWARGRFIAELGSRIGTRRVNGRDVQSIMGYSTSDPAEAQAKAEAERAALNAANEAERETARRQREAYQAEKREESRRQEAERTQRLEDAREHERHLEAQRAAERHREEQKRLALEARLTDLRDAGILAYVEFAPGETISAAEIAAKLPLAAKHVAGDLVGYRWFPACVAADGRLKSWDVDDDGSPIPRPTVRRGEPGWRESTYHSFHAAKSAYWLRFVAPGRIAGDDDPTGYPWSVSL